MAEHRQTVKKPMLTTYKIDGKEFVSLVSMAEFYNRSTTVVRAWIKKCRTPDGIRIITVTTPQ